MRRRKTILFILLSIIIAVAPVTNWSIDQNLVKGIVWRLTMIATFAIGFFWPRSATPNSRRFNKNLAFRIH